MSPGEDDCCTACSQSRISKLLFFFVRPVVESPDCTILCNASWLFCGRHRAKLPCCCSAVRLLCSLRFWLSVRCSNASASSATPAVSSCSWQALRQAALPLWQSVPALQHHAPVPAARVFDAAAGGSAWLYAIAKVHCSRSRAPAAQTSALWPLLAHSQCLVHGAPLLCAHPAAHARPEIGWRLSAYQVHIMPAIVIGASSFSRVSSAAAEQHIRLLLHH